MAIKEKRKFTNNIKTNNTNNTINNTILKNIIIIPLYFIIGKKDIFLYVLSLSLYNILSSCFIHIDIKDSLEQENNNYHKYRIFKLTTLVITVISLLFTIISIFIGDLITSYLNINNSFLIFLLMGISLIIEPIIKLEITFLKNINQKKDYSVLSQLYNYIEIILILFISIITFRILKINNNLSISLLFLPKIISGIIISLIIYKNINFKKNILNKEDNVKKLNYEIKKILTNNYHKSMIEITKYTYYYISVIVLYAVLSSIYNYEINTVKESIAWVYLYSLSLTNIVLETVKYIKDNIIKEQNIIKNILSNFNTMLTTTIILVIISKPLFKVLFNTKTTAIYFIMTSILSIFISLYDLTFSYIKNKKVIILSLLTGLIAKIILILPLISSVYRMGYNLIYGDILSTVVGFSISFIINYIYLKRKEKTLKILDKVLKYLYENIFLCIVLVLVQFILPIKGDNYISSLLTIIIYIIISIVCIKIRKKRRG